MDDQQGKGPNELFQLAYTVGFWLCDGHLSAVNGFRIGFTKQDKEPLEKCAEELEKVFGATLRIYRYEYPSRSAIYKGQLTSRHVHDWFLSCTHAKTIVPQEYFTAPVEVQRELLAGFLDGDMSVSVSGGRVRCEFSSTQPAFPHAVHTLCKRARIRTGAVLLLAERAAWRLTIRGDDVKNALLPMKSKRKLEKLSALASETLYTARAS
jgi:hypothetical protein